MYRTVLHENGKERNMARSEKRKAWNVAKQLEYIRVIPDIKKRIYASESETELTRILTTARHMMK